MRKIKIIHFITGLNVGGAEMMLLKVLPRMSVNFENVVCSTTGGEIAEKLKNAGIKVYSFNSRKWQIIKAIREFYKVIKKEKPDILITYLIHADLFGRVFGKIFGVRNILCSKRGSVLRNKFLMFLDRITSFWVKKYICVSQSTAREMINFWKFPKEKIKVIPNAIEIEKFLIRIDRKKKRQSLGAGEKDLLIVFTANLKEGKGHDYLLKSFAKVLQNRNNLKLILIGADQGIGQELEKLAKKLKIQKKVLFLGFRSDEIEILKTSDIFVFPSFHEGMSNSLLEGAAANLAVIASDIGPNKEIIEHNKTGLLFKTGSEKDLSDKLEKVINDKRLRKRLARNSFLNIKENFAINKTVRKLEKIYLSLFK